MADRVLGEREARAWDNFIRMSHAVTARIARELAENSALTVAEHDVLCALVGQGGSGARLGVLSEAMAWELSRLSHQLRRMQSRGLVVRAPSASDGRGVEYTITPAGLDAIRAAGPAHDQAVHRYLTAHLSPTELDALALISERVLDELAIAEYPAAGGGSPNSVHR